MVRTGLLKYGKKVCESCVDYAQNQLKSNTKEKKICHIAIQTEPLEPNLQEICYGIDRLDNEKLSIVAGKIGNNISPELKTDARYVTNNYKAQVETAPQEWITNRNPVVVSFLKSINESASSVQLIHAINAIYFISFSSCIMPFSFAINLLIYFFVRSKQVANVLFRHGPYGSYDSIRGWLDRGAEKPLTPPTGDLVVAFDNDQVLGKSWRVHVSNKMKYSVITSVLYLVCNPLLSLQKHIALSPSMWLPFITRLPCSLITIKNYEKPFHDAFRTLRLHFIEGRIKSVYQQQRWTDISDITDFVDNDKNTSEQHPTQQTDEQTDELTDHFINLTGKNDMYECASSSLNSSSFRSLGEPFMENPNSYARVRDALIKIMDDGNIARPGFEDRERKWAVIVCDACPYILACRLQESLYTCTVCEKHMYSTALSSHLTSCPTSVTSLTFQNIILMPGLGHEELNMLKCFNKLSWQPLLKHLGRILNFESEKAQTSLLNVSNHHKSWDAFLVLFLGTADELLIPYVRDSIIHHKVPNVDDYMKWASALHDDTYSFVREIMFTYALSILIYRIGVRRNNSEYIQTGRIKFSPLFTITHAPKYTEIELRQSIIRTTSPAPVTDFFYENESFSNSYHPSRHEGADYCLENVNRLTKKFKPPGVPDPDQWLEIFRNLMPLEKVYYVINLFLIEAC
jgi:7-cyano-7-deazaguanine synthase in queuosine biosynthesis